MSDSLRINPLAVNALQASAQEAGIREPPPVLEDGNSFFILRDAWEAWAGRQNVCFRWSSFMDLFRAQSRDDDPSSLSVEDLQGITVSAPDRKRAETEFAQRYGYPDAIIFLENEGRRILKMPSGAYWSEESGRGLHAFRQISREEGRRIESEAANGVFNTLNTRFETVPSSRFAIKTTFRGSNGEGAPSGRPLDMMISNPRRDRERNDLLLKVLQLYVSKAASRQASHFESAVRGNDFRSFDGVDYGSGNPNAVIAYNPMGPINRYFRSQPQNACMAASILNGGIFAGLNLGNDPRLLESFQKKLVHLQGSWDGRIDFTGLTASIEQGKIPGLTIRSVEPASVASLIEARTPVIALVPEFGNHAFAIIGVDRDRGLYRGIDTVTGMVVERAFNDPNREEKFISIEIQDLDRFLAWVTNK